MGDDGWGHKVAPGALLRSPTDCLNVVKIGAIFGSIVGGTMGAGGVSIARSELQPPTQAAGLTALAAHPRLPSSRSCRKPLLAVVVMSMTIMTMMMMMTMMPLITACVVVVTPATPWRVRC
jgi:hypothetical protein